MNCAGMGKNMSGISSHFMSTCGEQQEGKIIALNIIEKVKGDITVKER